MGLGPTAGSWSFMAGLDLEAVPADRRECLVTVYRGLAPSHLVAAVEGMDRGSLVPGVGGSRVGVRVHCNKEGAAAQPAHLSDGQGGRLGELFCHDGTPPMRCVLEGRAFLGARTAAGVWAPAAWGLEEGAGSGAAADQLAIPAEYICWQCAHFYHRIFCSVDHGDEPMGSGGVESQGGPRTAVAPPE